MFKHFIITNFQIFSSKTDTQINHQLKIINNEFNPKVNQIILKFINQVYKPQRTDYVMLFGKSNF